MTKPPEAGTDTDDSRPREITPPVQAVSRCEANRELAILVGNLWHEAEEHSRVLASLYELVCTLPYVIPRMWAARLLDEYMRHYRATEHNIESLQAFVGGDHA